ncbi:MAG: phosphatase PAP2 family protein [Chloroflexota bacterium]
MQRLFELDYLFYRLVHQTWRLRRLDPVMVLLSALGTKGIVWICIDLTIALFGGDRGRKAALVSFAALLLAEGTINLILKPAVQRARPFASGLLTSLLVAAPGPNSWPSAHAGSSLAAAIVIAAAYPSWSLVVVLLATAVGYSRVYVGVHYPLDVLAGFGVGLLAGGVCLLPLLSLGA